MARAFRSPSSSSPSSRGSRAQGARLASSGEERERLFALLNDPLRNRIGELTEAQLVGLRFACDAEISILVEDSISKKLSQGDIKKAIKVWRADYFRV
jgi:hypothetical protein